MTTNDGKAEVWINSATPHLPPPTPTTTTNPNTLRRPGFIRGQLLQQRGADGEEVAARQRLDLPDVAERRPHRPQGTIIASRWLRQPDGYEKKCWVRIEFVWDRKKGDHLGVKLGDVNRGVGAERNEKLGGGIVNEIHVTNEESKILPLGYNEFKSSVRLDVSLKADVPSNPNSQDYDRALPTMVLYPYFL